MDIFSALSLVGCLALFLYGMDLLGDGLTKVSGGKLEHILSVLTSTPLKGVFLGLGVTAVIQSSSATTVMVVGFVNSGIMNLNQAVGVIMGANIGTTVTAWILSLTGIQSNNFWVQLIKPSSFTPVLAMIGMIMVLTAKDNLKKKSIGQILLGFTILMYGMTAMSDAVSPLADDPSFTHILVAFSNPVIGVLVGAALTAIIQSSSASVGILQALCSTGVIPVSTSVPIIMGQNIGTCITAIISSIGASKNAKRAALIHLYFNIIGTIIFMTVYMLLYKFADIAFFRETASEATVALVHSVFNVCTTCLLFPFNKVLVKLAYKSIKDDKEVERIDEFKSLDDRFLTRPGYAIEQSRELTYKMANIAKENVDLAIEVINGPYDKEKVKKIYALESKTDKYEDELGKYLIKISEKSMTKSGSMMVSHLLHCIGDIERLSDHAINITESATEMHEKKMQFSDEAKDDLVVFSKAVHDILDETVKVFTENDPEAAKSVEPFEEVIDELNTDVKNRHIKRLTEGKCTIELGFILSDVSTNYERIADHCSNIALSEVSFSHIDDDDFEGHEYTLKTEDNEQFAKRVKEIKARYTLKKRNSSKIESSVSASMEAQGAES